MPGLKTLTQITIAFWMVVLLAHFDSDTHTFRDIFALENVPAFFIYGGFFLGLIKLAELIYRGWRSLAQT